MWEVISETTKQIKYYFTNENLPNACHERSSGWKPESNKINLDGAYALIESRLTRVNLFHIFFFVQYFTIIQREVSDNIYIIMGHRNVSVDNYLFSFWLYSPRTQLLSVILVNVVPPQFSNIVLKF